MDPFSHLWISDCICAFTTIIFTAITVIHCSQKLAQKWRDHVSQKKIPPTVFTCLWITCLVSLLYQVPMTGYRAYTAFTASLEDHHKEPWVLDGHFVITLWTSFVSMFLLMLITWYFAIARKSDGRKLDNFYR